MPKKGHRAASRQAQLRRKRRRTKGQPEIFAAGPIRSKPETSEADGHEEAPDLQSAPRQGTAQATVQAVRRPRPRAMAEPTVHDYLTGELRQIGIIAGLIGVILAILTVLLR